MLDNPLIWNPQSAFPCSWYRSLCCKRLFFPLIQVIIRLSPVILDVLRGAHFRSWRSLCSEQNYLGVLGIIWRTGCDFPIIGVCDAVLLAVCSWNDSQWQWEIRKSSVHTLFTSLSALHYVSLFPCSLLLHSGQIFFPQNQVKPPLTHYEGYSSRKFGWWPNEHIDFHLLPFLFWRDVMCTVLNIFNNQGMYWRSF